MQPEARETALAALKWTDPFWDGRAGLWTWAGHRAARRAWLAEGGQFAAQV